MKNHSSKGSFRRTVRLYTSVRIPWHLYLVQVLLGIVSAKVAMLYVPYLSEIKLGNIETPGLIWSYLGTMLLMYIISLLCSVPEFYARLIVGRNLQRKLISHAMRLPMRTYEKDASNMVAWITNDCQYADGLITAVVGFLTGIFSTFIAMEQMSAIDKTLVVLVPIIVVYIIFSTWLEGKLMFLRQRAGKLAEAKLTAFFAEHLGFLLNVKQLHTEKVEAEYGKKAIEQYYKTDIYMAVLTLLNSFVSGSLTSVIDIMIFVLGVPMVRDGKLGMPELVAFQSYIQLAYQYLSSLPGVYTQFMYYNGELFYIAKLMDEKEEVYERSRGMDTPDEDISFENVSFSYGETPVLKNVSFTIPKGRVTAVVGPNGSGKSTVFKLIERFYSPDEGQLLFGTACAEDIHLKEWRQSMTYVLQEPQLFDGTIRDNIAYGVDRDVTDEEIINAAKLACADGFIREFAEGYDYVIGDNGAKLSAGQRQRIAIARAVMMDPAYLLLDEATCNMDIYSEKEVTQALMKLMHGRTTVMITHDMSLLEHADRIVVLKDGVIEACGSADEVRRSSQTLQALIGASA